MSTRVMELRVLPDRLAISRLPADAPLPSWVWTGTFVSITRTADELSVVCAEDDMPDEVRTEGGWRALRVVGRLDFALTGVLAALAAPLAAAGVSIFALSTYDTDYVLVRAGDLEHAVAALERAGHHMRRDDSGE